MQASNTQTDKYSKTLSYLMHRYLPYWPMFILLMIACTIIAWKYIKSWAPVYEATATIMIKEDASGSSDSKIMESFNYSAPKINVENEIEVLHSRTLMKQVVEKLHLYAQAIETSNLTSAYISSPIVVKVKDPDETITEQLNIPFSFNKEKNQVSIHNKAYPLNIWNKTDYGVLMFSENPLQKGHTENQLSFQLIKPLDVVNTFLANLSITPVNKNSSVVLLKLKESASGRGEIVLNALAEAYNHASIDDKNAMVTNTLAFVEDRIKYVENDLDSLEKQIQFYKSKQGIVNLSEQGEMFLESLGANDAKIADMNLQLAVLDQVEKYVISKEDKSGIVPSSLGVSNPLLTDLLQKLYNAEIEHEKLQKTAGQNNIQTVSARGEIEKIKPSILENIRNQKVSMQASIRKLDESTTTYSSMLRTIPQKERELLEFSRQQAIKSSVYTFLLQKREETGLLRSGTVADNRIIDSAIATMLPYSSKKSTIYILAVVLGLMLGLGIVSAKELFSTKILFRKELETLSNVPVVAELAAVKSSSPFVVSQPQFIANAEQFRHLRASIGLYGRFTNKRKILVTSGISGEGKSFVSINLALSLALSGKKVVLLDLDLRNPKSSDIFKVTGEKGIVEFLEGSCEIHEIIKQSEFEQLYIVPAGGNTVNPTELLLSDRLDHLFRELDKEFDYLIVDTSPVDPVTDAYVLSAYCDTTLYIVRHGYTPKTMVHLLDENNKIKALKDMVIVFNGVRPRGFIHKGYGFGYGYGYENVYKDSVYRRERPVKEEAVKA